MTGARRSAVASRATPLVVLMCTALAGPQALAATVLDKPAADARADAAKTSSDINADARAAVAQALYAASATTAAAERAADARIAAQRRDVEALRTQLAGLPGRDAANQTRLRDVQTQLAQAQERYVAQLAERDRAYAQEIAFFRKAVQDIASTPEGEAALRRYNAGDEVGALAVLDRLIDAREKARKLRADIETAAERRRVATLALDARNKGKLRTDAVIARFEAVTKLDPGKHTDWVQLSRLYSDAGRLADSEHAARKAAESAADERDQLVALGTIGDVLLRRGYPLGALQRFRDSLEIAKRLSAADPNSARLKRDVSVSLGRIGDVLMARGVLRDLHGARECFEERLEIDMRLSADNPLSAVLKRGVSVSLEMLGDVLVAQGDLPGALQRYQGSLEMREQLSDDDRSSAGLRRDVSIGLNKLGEVLALQGDLPGAMQRFQDSLEIAERLAAEDPSSAELQRDVAVSLWKLAFVPGSGVTWERAANSLEAMKAKGILNPADEPRLQEARTRAAREGRP